MNVENKYNINLDEIKIDFEIKNNSLRHKQCKKFKLLPYAANEKTLVSNFNGVIGAFSRIISNKSLDKQFDFNEFIQDITDTVGEFEGDKSKSAFKSIVKSMFIDGEELINFDIKTINYIAASKSDEKVANFLYSIFFNDELELLVKKYYEDEVDNVLYKLVLGALPQLKDKQYNNEEYKCYLPFIRDLFIKDFKFIIQDQQLYKSYLKRFLEYYYMFYVSQLAIKLNDFEKADLSKPDPLYYALNWESISKNRIAYTRGWDNLKHRVESLFSHAITLELINHSNLDEQLGYVELNQLFNQCDEVQIEEQLDNLYTEYTSVITDKSWVNFTETNRQSGSKAFKKVYKLFEAIKYQFDKTTRSRANEAYNNWYVKFVFENFAKKRGNLGYNLNLTEDDIILMTKICINEEEKIKLNSLFKEFENRGMFFDKDSRLKIVELYEKLNLLEKKSDSGDAQYVKSVL